MACTVTALYSYGLDSYGLYSYATYSYGLYSYGLYRYGTYSYGLYSYGASWGLTRTRPTGYTSPKTRRCSLSTPSRHRIRQICFTTYYIIVTNML